MMSSYKGILVNCVIIMILVSIISAALSPYRKHTNMLVWLLQTVCLMSAYEVSSSSPHTVGV